MLLVSPDSKGKKTSRRNGSTLPQTSSAPPSLLHTLRFPLPTVNIGVCQLAARHLNRLCQLEKSHLLVGRLPIVPGPPAGSHMALGAKNMPERNKGAITPPTPQGNSYHRSGPREPFSQVNTQRELCSLAGLVWSYCCPSSSHLVSFTGRLL